MKIIAKISLFLGLGLLVSCYGTLKFQPVAYRAPAGSLYDIFRDDFRFEFSAKTPDKSTVVPPARAGCKVKLLPAGQDAFALKYYLTENSESSIKLQTYILYSDPVSKKLVRILKEKQEQGVKVEFIADCYTKYITKDQILYAQMERMGLDLLGYEPLYFTGSENPNLLIDINDLNMRFHEKYWIFDSQAAIIGGTNISQEYAAYNNKPRLMWRDQDVLLYGEVVRDIERAFDENMLYFSQKRENRPDLFNPQFYREQCCRKKKSGGIVAKEQAAAKENPRLMVGELTDDDVLVRFIHQRPRLQETYIHQAYIHLINTAQKRILIENSYILLDDSQFQALTDAARRGVQITIVTNSETTNDVFGLAPLSRYEYLPLIEAGIKIYEWQGIVPGHGSLHSKYAVFDDEVSVVGSYNLDPRSTFLNSEDIVVMRSRKVAEELTRYTEQIDIPQSRLITMTQARKWHNPYSPARIWTVFGMFFRDWW